MVRSNDYIVGLAKVAFGMVNLGIWFEMVERGYVDFG